MRCGYVYQDRNLRRNADRCEKRRYRCVNRGNQDGRNEQEYAPIEFPGSARSDSDECACEKLLNQKGYPFHTGVVQCKDSFYGQHEPERKPVGYDLLHKWEAWKQLGCLASKWNRRLCLLWRAALGCGSARVFFVIANQEREKSRDLRTR